MHTIRSASRVAALPPTLVMCLVLSACAAPLGFLEQREEPGYRAVEVAWRSDADGARLAGTLFLPEGGGAYPAIVFHPGSNAWQREPWNPIYAELVRSGLALLTYDKRGVGESEGECCGSDRRYLDLLAGDLTGAVRLLSRHAEIRADRVGLYGVSQGGWVVPLAEVAAPDEVAFTMIASGPAVSVGEEILYSRLTGDATCHPTGRSPEEIAEEMDRAEPSGFDPRPVLPRLTAPGLWQFCENDTSIPVERSIRILEAVADTFGLPFEIQRFPNCNHQFVEGGGTCEGSGARVDWWTPLLDWLEADVFSGTDG